MRKLGFALFLAVVAASYFGWDHINAVAAEVGHGSLFSVDGLVMALGSLGFAAVAYFMTMPAFNGVSWEDHATMEVKHFTVPCQAGGPDKWTTDKEERQALCFQMGALVFILCMIGFLTGLSGPIAVAMIAFGYVALMAQARKVLAPAKAS